jgi:hypothetical protein
MKVSLLAALGLALLAQTCHAWDVNKDVELWGSVWFVDENGVPRGKSDDADIYLFNYSDAYYLKKETPIYAANKTAVRTQLRDGEIRYMGFDKVALTPYKIVKWTKKEHDDYGYWGGTAVQVGADAKKDFKADGYVTTQWAWNSTWFDFSGLGDGEWQKFDKALKKNLLRFDLAEPKEIRKLAWNPFSITLPSGKCSIIEFYKTDTPAGTLTLEAGFTPNELEVLTMGPLAPGAFYVTETLLSAGRAAAIEGFQKNTGEDAYTVANQYLYGQRGYLAAIQSNFATAVKGRNKGSDLQFTDEESTVLACRLTHTGHFEAFKKRVDAISADGGEDARKKAVSFWRDFLESEYAFYSGFSTPEGRGRKYFSLPRKGDVNLNLMSLLFGRTKDCVEQFALAKDKCESTAHAEIEKLFPKPAQAKYVEPDEPVVVKKPADDLEGGQTREPEKPAKPRKTRSKQVKPKKSLEDMGEDLCKQMGEC